jgi:hypothetical protein
VIVGFGESDTFGVAPEVTTMGFVPVTLVTPPEDDVQGNPELTMELWESNPAKYVQLGLGAANAS